ncbi:PDZ and LIM domain protein 4-like [Branchiostoma floridae]|uniref:PDZ and LIM domain protein 4-like n=2 Tax=Branchiostoma floridae TaxID=7739 RepID=A0A9J7MGN2_BRAFL|nr:PDZ and LIM domain protein 4-like [Branchiostoma floridae]XP_035667141.1 PDZ and LIM domain protein 4-like [Branchiostoma floridae]XP_035667142.1 PDZ and LIM domain protein 4-like [Branchiostoma floridae]
MDVVPSVIRVSLVGSPPWGFELEGGAEVGTDLTIAQVDMGSKAHMANILPGDVLLQIGLEKTQQMEKTEALRKLCDEGGYSLSLVLGRAQPKVPRPKQYTPTGRNFNVAPKGWGGNPGRGPSAHAPVRSRAGPRQPHRQPPLGQAIATLEQTEDVPRGFRSVRPPVENPQTLPQYGMIKTFGYHV